MFKNDPDLPQFEFRHLVDFTGVNKTRLNNWLTPREGEAVIILSVGDYRSDGRGKRNLFSFRRMMQVAITWALVKRGVSPSEASKVALDFTDIGDDMRDPGCHFERGGTYLFLDGASSGILNVQEDDSFEDVLSRATECSRMAGRTDALVLLDLLSLEEDVRAQIPDNFERDVFRVTAAR